ncbi:MAG: FtsX-like permease family protein, partial [Deltaproteobacteria bacterium]|nr:FtsX-like permease family protein [Kofleriaceae bacterium]
TLDGGAGVAQVAGLHVVAGRDFVAEDLRSGGATAAIVTQDLAALMWLGRDPIGATFESRAHGPAVVVGVVDGMRTLLFGPEHARVLYAHEAPRSARFSLLVRSAPGRGRELHVALRDRLQQPGVHATVTSVAAEAARRSAPVGSVLGVLASMVGAIVVVVLIGSMGLTYYLVARRTREIGLRRAMGATRRDVIGELMLENLLLTAAGAVIGLAIVLFVLPALFQEQEEFHIKWSLVALSVAGVAALNLLATLVPASKAAAVPPVVASRTT